MFQVKDQAINELEKKVEEIDVFIIFIKFNSLNDQKDNTKLQEIIEDQRIFIQNNEETFRNEQKDKTSHKDEIQSYQDKIQELNQELSTLKYTLGSYHTEMSFKNEDTSKQHEAINNLNQGLDSYKAEIKKYEQNKQELELKVDLYQKKIEEYLEREEYIKELYNRQTDSKNDSMRLISEKDRMIQELHHKLLEANVALETSYKQMGLEDSQKRDIIDRLRSDTDNRLKVTKINEKL